MSELRPYQPTPQPSPAPDSAAGSELRATIAARLQRICQDMTPDAFNTLVDDIYAMKVRWREHGLWHDD
jgi:hypothetical protein